MGRNSNVQDSANNTIKQARNSLKLETNMQNADLVIENERLHTTIMVLNQKLNDWTDTQLEVKNLKKKNRELAYDCE